MFKDVKIGDRLYSLVYGWGVVEEIGKENLQITVKFKNERDTFTFDGKMYETDMHQTLFWDEIKFQVPKKPLPDLEVDTKVIVWNKEGLIKCKRYFKEFTPDGIAVCFIKGYTSWTSSGETAKWEHFEVAE